MCQRLFFLLKKRYKTSFIANAYVISHSSYTSGSVGFYGMRHFVYENVCAMLCQCTMPFSHVQMCFSLVYKVLKLFSNTSFIQTPGCLHSTLMNDKRNSRKHLKDKYLTFFNST